MIDEVFAPVAPIATFATDREALALANRSDYGLAAYVYAADEHTGHRFAAQIEAGMVGVNLGIISNAAAPFGGVKSSGLGREGGLEGIEEYLSLHYTASPQHFAL
jgi:succinate-semialdehyde dehydrogenase/glutarate-semialdehyde dehydrogenase